MKAKLTQWIVFTGVTAAWLSAMSGCSTTQIAPPPAPPPPPPAYVQVPHPAGPDLGDVSAIMLQSSAPNRESLSGCDADFRKLVSLTKSDDERRQGARELVKKEPVQYHWCFYKKVLDLEEVLRNSTYVDERQKVTLETYQFLVPIARGFLAEFRDTRYLRWAIAHYRRTSEWVFFKKMELSPEGTSELVQVSNPFGLWRDPTPEMTILEKYGISKPAGEASAGAEVKPIFPKQVSDQAAAPVETPVPVEPPASVQTPAPTAAPAGTPARIPAAVLALSKQRKAEAASAAAPAPAEQKKAEADRAPAEMPAVEPEPSDQGLDLPELPDPDDVPPPPPGM